MADGSEIKSRIASIKDTKKVTDAMYMISSAKLQRAQREVQKTAPYFKALHEEITELLGHIPASSNRYFKAPVPAEGGHIKHGVLLVTSDKGLAGPYNRSAIGVCRDMLRRHPDMVVFIVGEYGRQFFAAEKLNYVEDFRYSADLPTVWKARRICADLLEYLNSGAVDVINIISTDYRPGGQGVCERRILLPLSRSLFAPADGAVKDDDAEFCPDPDTVLNGIIPGYLTGFIYSSLVDSYCSEQQARMTAMNDASRSAELMLKELQLKYNRVRQAAITREMTEIVSGARALKKAKRNAAAEDAGNGS